LIRETTTGNNTVITEILRILSSLKNAFFRMETGCASSSSFSLSLCLSSLRESIFFKRDERRLRAAARVERDWRFFFFFFGD